MSGDPIPFERRASDRRADERRGEDRRAEFGTADARRAEDAPAMDRRADGTPYGRRADDRRGEERRAPTIAADWRAAQTDAWRLEGFKMQIAQEAQQRRDTAGMQLALWSGVALGVVGSAVALLT